MRNALVEKYRGECLKGREFEINYGNHETWESCGVSFYTLRPAIHFALQPEVVH